MTNEFILSDFHEYNIIYMQSLVGIVGISEGYMRKTTESDESL